MGFRVWVLPARWAVPPDEIKEHLALRAMVVALRTKADCCNSLDMGLEGDCIIELGVPSVEVLVMNEHLAAKKC